MAFSLNNKGPKPFGSDPNKTGDLSAATQAAAKPTRRSARGSDVAKQEKRAARERKANASAAPAKGRAKAVAKGTSKASAKIAKTSGAKKLQTSESQQALLKYANDNAIVRGFYQLTTGPQRHLFYLVVGVLIAMGIYLPVRDFYIANRTSQILTEQKAIRDKYNDSIGEEVKGYMSQEGIEDRARKDLGMVMPGEQTITVEGLDEDGNPIEVEVDAEGNPVTSGASSGANGDASSEDGASDGSEGGDADDAEGSADAEGEPQSTTGAQGAQEKDDGKLKGKDAADKSKTGAGAEGYDPSKDPTTSAEVEAAEKAVLENSPWYWKVLDVLFFFDGANGMAVVSTGE